MPGRAVRVLTVVHQPARVGATAYLGAVSSLAIVAVAQLAYLTDHPHTFGSFTDALLGRCRS